MPTHAPTASSFHVLRRPGTQTLIRALRTWFVARQTRIALRQLTPRELADIGVAPDKIDEIAARVARQ